jgi:alkylhydroperoxidase family enzyme
MSRRSAEIRPAPLGDPATSELLAKGLTHDGSTLNAARTLAHHPRLLKRFTVFAGLFLTHSLLPDRDRELVTLRRAHRFGCEYDFGHHMVLGAGLLTSHEIDRTVRASVEWYGFDPNYPRQWRDSLKER